MIIQAHRTQTLVVLYSGPRRPGCQRLCPLATRSQRRTILQPRLLGRNALQPGGRVAQNLRWKCKWRKSGTWHKLDGTSLRRESSLGRRLECIIAFLFSRLQRPCLVSPLHPPPPPPKKNVKTHQVYLPSPPPPSMRPDKQHKHDDRIHNESKPWVELQCPR